MSVSDVLPEQLHEDWMNHGRHTHIQTWRCFSWMQVLQSSCDLNVIEDSFSADNRVLWVFARVGIVISCLCHILVRDIQ